MTIETYQQQPEHGIALPAVTAGPGVGPEAVAALQSWLQAAHLAEQIAQGIAASSFVKRAFRGKPAECASAILAGLEIGMTPREALQSFDVIEGTAGLTSSAMRRQVRRAGHEIEFVGQPTHETCTIRGRRRGSQHWEEVTWTIEDAKRAGLDGKDVWKKYPRNMLIARATTNLCDFLFGDALGGIPCAETLQDMDPADVRVIEAPSVTQVTAAEILAKPLPAIDQPAPVEDGPSAIDQATWRAINQWFADSKLPGVNGNGQAAARLKVIDMLVGEDGRTIAKGSDLTADEGHLVLDTLRGNGHAIVGEALGWPAEQQQVESEAVADVVGDADPDADGDYDPTGEPGFGQDGGE